MMCCSGRGSNSSEVWKPCQLSEEKILCFIFKNKSIEAPSFMFSGVLCEPIVVGVEGEQLLQAQGTGSPA